MTCVYISVVKPILLAPKEVINTKPTTSWPVGACKYCVEASRIRAKVDRNSVLFNAQSVVPEQRNLQTRPSVTALGARTESCSFRHVTSALALPKNVRSFRPVPVPPSHPRRETVMQRTSRLTGAFVRSGVTRTMGTKHNSTVTSAGFENVPTGHEEQASPASDHRKIVLFGGNGFVGQGIVNSALKSGVDVVSINRSGQPKNFKPPAFSSGKIEWKMGDINDPSTYKDELKDAVGVISCVGAFGSNEV